MDDWKLYFFHTCDGGELEDFTQFLWWSPLKILWDSRLEKVDATSTIVRDSRGSFCPVLSLQHHYLSQELDLLEGRGAGLGDGGHGRDYAGCSTGDSGLLFLWLWQIWSTIVTQLLVADWILVERTRQGILLAGLPVCLQVTLFVMGLIPNFGCTAKTDALR